MFYGSYVALVTPFKNDHIDFSTLENLVEWHIEQGTHGLLPCGTTGESPLLSVEEQKDLITCVVEKANKRVPVIAGTSATSSAQTIQLTQQAKDCGADAALIVTPPYIKPTQQGLYQHFKAIHDAVGLPIVLYNNPGRAAVTLQDETLEKLSQLPHIVGVKDATSDLSRPTEVRRRTGREFVQLSGDDATTTAFLSQGGHGCISVTANVAPKWCAELQNAWIEKDFETVARLRDLLHPLHNVLFCETSPGPAKYALSLLGKCDATMRAPLCEISEESKQRVEHVLKEIGLL